MKFFNLSISLGEIVAIAITVGTALMANEQVKKKMLVKIDSMVCMLENAIKLGLTGRDLANKVADMSNKGFADSSSMHGLFEFWSNEYLVGTIKPSGTAEMHFKKSLYEHLLEINDLKPCICTGIDFYGKKSKLREILVDFLKQYYKTGMEFCNQSMYQKYKHLPERLTMNFQNFIEKVNELDVVDPITLQQVKDG